MTKSLSFRRFVLLCMTLPVGGCTWNTPQTTVVPASDFARAILDVYRIIWWATLGIAIVVFAALGWVLLRYRARPGADLLPQTRGHTGLEIAWTVGPALVLLVIAVPTIRVVFTTQGNPPPGALEVRVRAWQWWWEFQYTALGIVTANELYLPAGRPVLLRLEGGDVIHSFWVPRLGGKRDAIPGRANHITLTPDTPGVYSGQCAEFFCGVSHANMRMRVIVDAAGDFERWVRGQRTLRRRHIPDDDREPHRLDREPAGPQTGREDAGAGPHEGAGERRGGVPGETQMMTERSVRVSIETDEEERT